MIERYYKATSHWSYVIYNLDTEGLLFRADIQDLWDKVLFSDGIKEYIINKGWKRKTDKDEPLLTNYDWGNIIRIYAVYNWKPFQMDVNNSLPYWENLYFAEGENNLGELLGVKSSITIFCGKNYRLVRLTKYTCITWLSGDYDISYGPLLTFELGHRASYFI